MRLRTIIAVVGVLVVGGGVAAGLVVGDVSRAGSSGRKLTIVAAENVYGDMARQIGGGRVAVVSILSNPNADPHLFEPGTATGLSVAHAQLVIQNGLGYDTFMARLEAAAPNALRRVVTVAEVLGVHGADANPHLWYDVPKLPRVAAAIAVAMERADPEAASVYRGGLQRFDASLRRLRGELSRIRARFGGAAVAYTEPVPGYLIAAAGLVNRAPTGFTRAIEEGREPSPQSVAAMTALISQRRVRVLLYNSQAVSPITRQLRDQAQRVGVPVVAVTETLPPRRSLQQWQLAQALALEAALAR